MGSVTSLGLSSPAGLAYAIQEQYLPTDPPKTSYTWNNYTNCDTSFPFENDELLITSRCVIWSRRGIFRKSYNFDIEKENVSHALLTTFPSVGPLAGRQTNPNKEIHKSCAREEAIVVFLQTQAHIYFLFGTSHIIHLPFEVESAFAAPNGVIMLRKLGLHMTENSLISQKSPQKSFVPSQEHQWSTTSSQISSLSVADIGELKRTPQKTVKDVVKDLGKDVLGSSLKIFETNWPRIFSLSDPLAEIGLVVAQKPTLGRNDYIKKPMKMVHLDAAEEILYVSRQDDFSPQNTTHPFVIALTWNRETCKYSVWKFASVEDMPSINDKTKVMGRNGSRRRSSYAPAVTTGTTTPVITGQQNLRDSSFGSQQVNLRKSLKIDGSRDQVVDLVSALDPDFESQSLPRKKSRRVSSMLARADLSNSHERSTFSDLATGQQHVTTRRVESLGSQNTRVSNGAFDILSTTTLPQMPLINPSLSGFLEGSADGFDDEICAGDIFEERLGSIGFDDGDFSTLKQEIILTKIGTVTSNHSSVQKNPAKSKCKVFTVAAPQSVSDESHGISNLICIVEPDEKKLINIILYTKIENSNGDANKQTSTMSEKEVILGPVLGADNVIDACRIDDGSISRILVLSETDDGYGELTLQAPWSIIIKVPLSTEFLTFNYRNLSQNLQNFRQQGGTRQPNAICGLRNSRPPGCVDLLDDDGDLHQICILLEPRNPDVCKILETCRELLPIVRDADSYPSFRIDGVLVFWWSVMQWLRLESIDTPDPEWTALTILLLATPFGVNYVSKFVPNRINLDDDFQLKLSDEIPLHENRSWQLMLAEEARGGNPFPSWTANAGWAWLIDEVNIGTNSKDPEETVSIFDRRGNQSSSFIQKHVNLTRRYLSSAHGGRTALECLPTWANNSLESRITALQDLFIGLHLLREEEKLDVMTSDSFNTGRVSLTAVLSQMARWFKWLDWMKFYETEEASLIESEFDNDTPIQSTIPEPFECPSIYDWMQKCLSSRSSFPFMTISQITSSKSTVSDRFAHKRCFRLTPRTLIFKKFFQLITPCWSPVQIIESFSLAGGDAQMLETLPEAILAPLQEAIIICQSVPPSTWSKTLLNLVGREDVNISLNPGQMPRVTYPKTLVCLVADATRICMSINETETTGTFDGTAEVDRQSVTRLIFKDDRRMNEAIKILDTTRPAVTFCKSEPHWSDSQLLEAQKELAQILANRTLAIPSGRGLLYYSSRIPLLTQKWNISGFNLSFIMKPENNLIAADKSPFTEEKVCWAFFHAGVAAGLQISRDTKGIDTSWILYNKPLPDLLNNRHAGFLLALGLNGHLKSVAKWVAFKYLTPKHTMTSIGLLLGLAASYLGTMDTLITRLLSVHVTRMLPSGAAELNLSPLTQTTGIMGIGLVYCNTQHRRMSDIMVSEIEYIDTETDEEPLRNEGYRLAAGFALGFINLGKGSDLKGLHDMRLTERLLTLAVGSKKVDLVHVLDKATAAAVMGIALIFMKSENQILARKIDIPNTLVQFDYVRPDIFLLRTVASRLIMWKKIEASFEWIKNNLPESYRQKSKLDSINMLSTEDLAFYDIIAGLCFSISLRFAGSACIATRDLLVHYLDQLIRICRIEATTYDEKLTRNTVRNCQDLLALSAATVMAGTGDLVIFRRLRSLHGRNDTETPYGSHLTAHLAIGALFLGGGTFTFGTSNLAIGALLVAFYPIFPSSVHDNRSHLQAFRHFWTLAAEPRCLITKDIDTNQPVSVPIIVSPRNGDNFMRLSPCLLPELDQIKSIRTDSSDFWNLSLNLENNPGLMTAFKSTQTIFVRRRPAHSSASNTFQASLQALSHAENRSSHPLEWIFELNAFKSFTKAEKALVLPSDSGGSNSLETESKGTVVDARLVLENAMLQSGKKDRLLGLKLLFDWVDSATSEKKDTQWIRKDVVEKLKTKMWMLIMQEE